MKKISFLVFFLATVILVSAQSVANHKTKAAQGTMVEMVTSQGKITFLLYDETPLHRDNFLKLVKNHTYDGLLFHRVIKDFMVQAGDPKSRDAKPGQPLGDGTLGYTVPAEFRADLIHKRGALCAARQGDQVNPKKASSASQFYIVQGQVWDDKTLDMMEQRFGKKFTAEQRKVYTTVGGTPHLDGDYTVFGEVVDGMEVVNKIAAVQCDRMDRPLQDVKIISVKVLK
ncbi:MAG: peptidylprolyl isomerase [Bacteroidales bacterium]|nr:peptidylprolyl isomerase [Bacteroidales bacterium]